MVAQRLRLFSREESDLVSGRSAVEQNSTGVLFQERSSMMNVQEFLSEKHVGYEAIAHRDTYDAQRLAQELHTPGCEVRRPFYCGQITLSRTLSRFCQRQRRLISRNCPRRSVAATSSWRQNWRSRSIARIARSARFRRLDRSTG